MATRSRRINNEVNSIKIEWLNNKLNENTNTTVSTPTVLPLRYRTLTAIIRDSTDENLMQIIELINQERITRGTRVTTILYYEQPEVLYDLSSEIYNEVIQIALDEYLTHDERYIDLSSEQLKNLIIEVFKYLRYFDSNTPTLVNYSKEGVPLYRLPFQTLNTGLSDVEFEELANELQNDDGILEKYTSIANDNEFLMRAIENVNHRGITTPGVIVYTFTLPLGKEFDIHTSNMVGQYPVILDPTNTE